MNTKTVNKKSIAYQISQRIKEDIDTHSYKRLPSMRALASIYNVSTATVHKAIALLKEQNIVNVYQGGRITVSGTEEFTCIEEIQEKEITTFDRLYKLIHEGIVNGSYRKGQPLPKVAYLAINERVSHHAVTAVYRKLSEENLVHKDGRTWVAGPEIVTYSSDEYSNQPVVILIESREEFWRDTAQRPFFESFCRSFQLEVEASNVQFLPVLFEKEDSAFHVLPSGREEILSLIQKLGHRYRGCLIVNSLNEVPALKHWISELLLYKKPVVWFDRLKEAPEYSFNPTLYSRCHESETRAVSIALEHLLSYDHTTIAFPSLVNESWVRRRSELLKRISNEQHPSIELITSIDKGVGFQLSELQTRANTLERWANGGSTFIRNMLASFKKILPHLENNYSNIFSQDLSLYEKFFLVMDKLDSFSVLEKTVRRELNFLKWMIYITPVLSPILAHSSTTAILAPNDTHAHHFYYWIKAVGLEIPDQISIMSFDNLWFMQHLAVTSVDFGYGYLGFAAFHSIMQDITIQKDARGNIAAQPRIVHRGTVSRKRREIRRTVFESLCIQG